mmetsp:Transcript_31769/g.98292  ORF Transcript_31769/g.98292 Transcript_31769/m.98292 type:complete len:297 (-) Transcript_31769:1667-2557(-)
MRTGHALRDVRFATGANASKALVEVRRGCVFPRWAGATAGRPTATRGSRDGRREAFEAPCRRSSPRTLATGTGCRRRESMTVTAADSVAPDAGFASRSAPARHLALCHRPEEIRRRAATVPMLARLPAGASSASPRAACRRTSAAPTPAAASLQTASRAAAQRPIHPWAPCPQGRSLRAASVAADVAAVAVAFAAVAATAPGRRGQLARAGRSATSSAAALADAASAVAVAEVAAMAEATTADADLGWPAKQPPCRCRCRSAAGFRQGRRSASYAPRRTRALAVRPCCAAVPRRIH